LESGFRREARKWGSCYPAFWSLGLVGWGSVLRESQGGLGSYCWGFLDALVFCHWACRDDPVSGLWVFLGDHQESAHPVFFPRTGTQEFCCLESGCRREARSWGSYCPAFWSLGLVVREFVLRTSSRLRLKGQLLTGFCRQASFELRASYRRVFCRQGSGDRRSWE